MTRICFIGMVEDYINPSRPHQIDHSYTMNVYQAGISVVNDALNEVYTEDNDYEGLRTSINNFKTLI